MRLFMGMKADATDGPCGLVEDVIVDPARRRVTHLVIAPQGVYHGARLVPVEAIEALERHVVLAWTTAQVQDADPVQETDVDEVGSWPHTRNGWDVGIVQVMVWPRLFSVGGPAYDEAQADNPDNDSDEGTTTTTEYDRIPSGTIELRRESAVRDRNDEVVGHVEGLVLEAGHGITHLLVDRGHMWRHREITVPVAEVASFETDLVRLRISHHEMATLPSIPFHRHEG